MVKLSIIEHVEDVAKMKIDQDYIKGLLEAFENSTTGETNVNELKKLKFDYETDIFIFHMRLLDDKKLIRQVRDFEGFGLIIGSNGHKNWYEVALRLTVEGHDFLDAIRNKEVWSTIKIGFKDASIGTLVDVSKKLFESYIQKKINNLLE
jgi:hypothetical protein